MSSKLLISYIICAECFKMEYFSNKSVPALIVHKGYTLTDDIANGAHHGLGSTDG